MVDSRQEHIKLGTYPPEQVYQVLQTSTQGLSLQEVKERQATYGPNQLKESKTEPISGILLVLWRSYCGLVALSLCFLIV